MSSIISTTRTHAAKAIVMVLLWAIAALVAEWSINFLVLGGVLVFGVSVWLFSTASTVGSSGRQRLAALNPPRQEWWGIILGVIVGAVAGALLFTWLSENQSESWLTAVLTRWGLIFGALGAWIGKWLVGTLGGTSFRLPFLAVAWGARRWVVLIALVIGAIVYVLQANGITVETEAIETAVSSPNLIIPGILLLFFIFWGIRRARRSPSGSSGWILIIFTGRQTAPRWFVVVATVFGVILGIVLAIPTNENPEMLTRNSATAAFFLGGTGWLTARSLYRIADSRSRTILTRALIVASSAIAIVYNLPSDTATLPNALTAGGFLGLLTGLLQLRFNVWTFLRILGLGLLGAILIINQAGFSFAQIYVLAGLIFGLLATMLIFNWVANRS